jgi:hypothetical protein
VRRFTKDKAIQISSQGRCCLENGSNRFCLQQ